MFVFLGVMLQRLSVPAGFAAGMIFWSGRVNDGFMVCALVAFGGLIVWQLFRWLGRSRILGGLEIRMQAGIAAKLRPLVVLSLGLIFGFLVIEVWHQRPGLQSLAWRELVFVGGGVVAAMALLSAPEIRSAGIAFGGRLISWNHVDSFAMSSIASRPVLLLKAKPEIRGWKHLTIPIVDHEIAAVEKIISARIPRHE